MPSKTDILFQICSEFSKAQTGDVPRWKPTPGQLSFPPLLPVGNGEHLSATEDLLRAVSKYADMFLRSSAALRTTFSLKEFHDVVRVAFGRGLKDLQTTQPSPDELMNAVDALIQEQIDARKRDVNLVVGCWLFEESSAYPVVLGPVIFSQRTTWLAQQVQAGKLSPTIGRRLQRKWSGERLRNRKSEWAYRERALSDAIGKCPVICEVRTHGLSVDLALQKGLLAARIAIATLSLPWENPQRALQRMSLLYDGPPRSQDYVMMSQEGYFGSGKAMSRVPFGQHSTEPVRSLLGPYKSMFNTVAESLSAYVNPHDPAPRPSIANAVFLSLLWFHQGCRDGSDQMAVTAFAASLDALAAGGNAAGIKELVQARLGVKSSSKVMADGRTSGAVIEAIYNAGRSRFIHGNSTDHVEDWAPLRTTAMSLAHQVIVETTLWLGENCEVKDVKALRRVM